jgi:hypothetical protein
MKKDLLVIFSIILILACKKTLEDVEPFRQIPVEIDFSKAEPLQVTTPAPVGKAIVVGDGTIESINRESIQKALDLGGHITFNTGGQSVKVYIDKSLAVKRHGTILDGGGLITLDARKERRILYSVGAHNSLNPRFMQGGVKELNWMVKGITFINGKTTGIAYGDEPNPSVNDGSGNGNRQSGSGSALWSGLWNQLWVIDCKFFDNETPVLNRQDEIGGAIYARGGNNSRLTIAESYFQNNKGTVGGAINCLLSSLTVVRSVFYKNTSSYAGGAIYTDGSNGDSAENSEALQGRMRLHASIFKENISNTQGGGVFLFVYKTKADITECWFDKNEARTENGIGGGLRTGNGYFSVRRCSFTENIAHSQGGGLWLGEHKSPFTFIIENSTFFKNKSLNTAKVIGTGGAISSQQNGQLFINNCTITRNEAVHGGGIFGNSNSNIILQNSILADNLAHNHWNVDYNVSKDLAVINRGGNIQWLTNNINNQRDAIQGVEVLDPLLSQNTELNEGFTPSLSFLSQRGPFGKGELNTTSPAFDQRRKARNGRNDSGSYQQQ